MSTAAVTPTFFRQAVQYLMNDPAGLVYTATRIDEAFTRVVRRVARERFCFREESGGDFVAGQMAQARKVNGMPIEIEDVIVADGNVRRRLDRTDPRMGLDKRPVIGWPSSFWFEYPSTLQIYEAPPAATAYTVAARTMPAQTAWIVGTPVEVEELLIVEVCRELHRTLRDSQAEEALAEEAEYFGVFAETAVDANHALPEATSADWLDGFSRSD